eukprot:scaffold2591_cov417-Prasinococcus_capsulatus_cf.AAC.7
MYAQRWRTGATYSSACVYWRFTVVKGDPFGGRWGHGKRSSLKVHSNREVGSGAAHPSPQPAQTGANGGGSGRRLTAAARRSCCAVATLDVDPRVGGESDCRARRLRARRARSEADRIRRDANHGFAESRIRPPARSGHHPRPAGCRARPAGGAAEARPPLGVAEPHPTSATSSRTRLAGGSFHFATRGDRTAERAPSGGGSVPALERCGLRALHAPAATS